MLSENIKVLRKSKGMSQAELALRLHVVRQTISKWEQGLSVPDSDMLVSLSNIFETPVSDLLGETPADSKSNELKALSDQLELINQHLLKAGRRRRNRLHRLSVSLCLIIVILFISLLVLNSPYLRWDYSDPEMAVAGTILHAFEWLFIRLSPFALAGAITGALLTRKKA